MKIALVIGRFQIVGNQHVDLFKQIEKYADSDNFEKISVGIATTGRKDEENPFEAEECLEMIRPIAEKTADKMTVKLQLKIIPDINDPVRYNTYVAEMLGFNLEKDKILVFSENQWTISCFEKRKGYEVVVVKENIKMHSTFLRELWQKGKDLAEYIPESTMKFLGKIK